MENNIKIEDITICIKKKAKRNGKVFEKRISLSTLLEHNSVTWEGDTYTVLEKRVEIKRNE